MIRARGVVAFYALVVLVVAGVWAADVVNVRRTSPNAALDPAAGPGAPTSRLTADGGTDP